MPAAAAKATKTFTYVVEGTKLGEFPLDMLRRDESRAATQADQQLIDRLKSMGMDKDDLPKIVRVTLLTTCERHPPNAARWESFGWKVIASNHPRNYDIPDAPPPPHTGLHHDDLRAKTMKKLAAEVVKLRGLVHAASPAFDAIRYASDVAGQDRVYREQAIGFVTATRQIACGHEYPGLLSGKDKDVLGRALDFARDLLMYDDEERVRTLCDGDMLTMITSELGLLRGSLEGSR